MSVDERGDFVIHAKVRKPSAFVGLRLDLHELTVLQQGFTDKAAVTAVSLDLARPQTTVLAN